jgi:hypothetical protein
MELVQRMQMSHRNLAAKQIKKNDPDKMATVDN